MLAANGAPSDSLPAYAGGGEGGCLVGEWTLPPFGISTTFLPGDSSTVALLRSPAPLERGSSPEAPRFGMEEAGGNTYLIRIPGPEPAP
jgi:hypothetical protein